MVTRAHRGFMTVYGHLGRDFARWEYEWYYGVSLRYAVASSVEYERGF